MLSILMLQTPLFIMLHRLAIQLRPRLHWLHQLPHFILHLLQQHQLCLRRLHPYQIHLQLHPIRCYRPLQTCSTLLAALTLFRPLRHR